MTSKIKIALDCMGGDDAPIMVVRGADLAIERQPDIFFHLVGNEEEIIPLIKASRHLDSDNHQITHTQKR